jgi:hypothetical protein
VGEGLPFETRISLDGFEENIARSLSEYLTLPEAARQRCREIVRRNSVDRLSWTTLAERIVETVGG